MPSVAEELAALKQRSLTKNFAEKLKNADGLSTPEQEQANLQNTNKKNRASTYKKDAVKTLNAGTKAVDQDLAFKQQQIAQKKEDLQKKEEAAKNLKSFNTAKVAATAKEANGKQTVPAAPATAPTPTPPKKVEEADDVGAIPELEEIEDIPQLVEEPTSSNSSGAAATAPQETYVPPVVPKRAPNRAEKKAKKTVEKLGMKGVPGIARVTLKLRGSQGFYTIFQPDVYEKNGTYVVFGEAQQGAGIMDQQQQAARAAKMLDTPVPAPTTAAAAASEDDAPEGVVDETGLEAKDIELVMGQAGCSRAKAASALRQNDGDLVNAIMSLTT